MNCIVLIGDAESTVDLCRYTAIDIFNTNKTLLVIDASKTESVYRSVLGKNGEGTINVRGICYSNSIEKFTDGKLCAYDVVLIYCQEDAELKPILDIVKIQTVVLTYGIGRYNYEKACLLADILGQSQKDCILIYRNKHKDATLDVIKHLVNVKSLFLAPHTDSDYDIFEKIDYGSNKLYGLSESMLSAVKEISLTVQ